MVHALSKRATGVIVLALLASLGAPGQLNAQPASHQIHKPTASNRLVHLFDFEEQDINHEPVPMHWVRAQDSPPARPRPGFPKWNKAAFDLTVSSSGAASVKLPTRGGSTAMRLVSGVVPVIPGGNYEISVKVKTAGLHNARARLVARFTDAKANPIESSTQATPLVLSDDDWTTIKVLLRGDYDNAAWVLIDLELLQPDMFPPEDAGADSIDFEIGLETEDLSGAVWFDDVTIRIIPIVTLEVVGDSNVVVSVAPPVIFASINDVVGDRLSATLRLTDLAGQTIDELTIESLHSGIRNLYQPDFPGYGWWRVAFTVFMDDQPIASATRSLAWLPPPSNPYEANRFGLLVHEGVEAPRTSLMDLIDASGVGSIDLPYWRKGQDLASIQGELPSFTSLIELLLDRNIDVTLALDTAPTDLAAQLTIADDKVLEALVAGRDAWAPWLDEAISRFGQRVRRWRLGSFSDSQKQESTSRAQHFSIAAQFIDQNVFKPLPTLPWDGEIAPASVLKDAALLVKAPSSYTPTALAELASRWDEYSEATMLIEPISTDRFGADAAMTDLAIRTIRAWSAAPDRLMLEQPWAWRTTRDGSLRADPAPALAVWSRLGEHLRGRTIVGTLPVAQGAVALVLNGPAGGAIAAWNEWAQPNQAQIDVYLTDGPVQIFDLFGNEQSIELVNGMHHIQLSQTPIFIEGVDAELASFRAGFSITPAQIESTAELHEMTLELTNPWPVSIDGDLQIIEPTNWSFSPQTFSFTIPAGETERIPIQTSFGLSELAGEHMLRADVRLIATKSYPTISISTPIQVGLSGVELIPSYQISRRNGQSVVTLTLLVINTSTEPATLMAYAQAPGRRRQQAPISTLEPGGSAVRNFVFTDPDEQLRGAEARVGVTQISGLGQLTVRLTIN